MRQIAIRYGESEEDVVAIHKFLLEVAHPMLLGRVDTLKSLHEIMRVLREGAALLALLDGQLVGTLGLIRVPLWYSQDSILTERWMFVLPSLKNTGAGAMLLGEAAALAQRANLPLVIHGKPSRRARQVGAGIVFAPQLKSDDETEIPEFIPTREVMH